MSAVPATMATGPAMEPPPPPRGSEPERVAGSEAELLGFRRLTPMGLSYMAHGFPRMMAVRMVKI